LTRRLRIEAEEGTDLRRYLLAFHAPDARTGDDGVDLLLARSGLVVLSDRRSRRQLEPVDPERLQASSRRTKRTAPPGPSPSMSATLTTL
jgi:hypothetical protein